MDDKKSLRQDNQDKNKKSPKDPKEAITHLKQHIEVLEREKEIIKAQYLRALADYQNLERRVQKEKEENATIAEARFIQKLLPFYDNLEKAEVFIKDPGLKMIKDELSQILRQSGVQELDLKGKEFDPATAEAIEVIEGQEDNVIVEVVRNGFSYKNKLLRPAHVKVSKKKQ